MRTIIKMYIIILFISCINYAQLKQITNPNMYSEVPIYENEKGEQYSSIVVFKYKTKLVDLPKGTDQFYKNNIKHSSFKELTKSIENKYGEFTLSKVVPDAEWGDTLKINKRTKQLVNVPDLSQIYKIQFSKPVNTDSVNTLIKTYPSIEYAEGPLVIYTTLTPNDPEYTSGTDTKWAFNVIKAEQAWNITTGSSNIKIGIHDRFGEQYQVAQLHEDLVGKVVWSYLPWGYGDHGIMVAGIAGAMTNNNTGVASLGWNLSLMPSLYFISSITSLVDNGADVINFSWVTTSNTSLQNAIFYALQNGVVCVASAGNTELTVPGVRYPAAYNFGSTGQVIAVSGTQLSSGVEQFISGFNYSPGTDPINDPTNAFIDFAAPGHNIRALSWTSSNEYFTTTVPGTSISTPFVSALVGLMLSVNSSLTPNQIYDILKRTSEKIGQYSYDANGWNRYLGYGRIDAEDAVNAATGAPAKPKNLHFTYSSSEHPSLGWDANSEANISGYQIYREYDESGNWNSAGYVSHPTTTFIDYLVDYTKPIWAKTVRYKVKAVNSSSQYSVYSNMIETTGIMLDPKMGEIKNHEIAKYEEDKLLFTLNQNHPNPFNPSTSISFSLPQKSFTTLKIYDILGREIEVLVNDLLHEGNYSFNFDGDNLPSGLYIYRLSTEIGVISRKMLLMK